MKKLLLLFIATTLLSGCATQGQESYVSRSMSLSMGMTKDQVTAIMGAPRRAAARQTNEGLSESYSWWSPKRIGLGVVDNEIVATDRVFVRFLNGSVVEWGDKYDPSEMMDKSIEKSKEMVREMQNNNSPARPAANSP